MDVPFRSAPCLSIWSNAEPGCEEQISKLADMMVAAWNRKG